VVRRHALSALRHRVFSRRSRWCSAPERAQAQRALVGQLRIIAALMHACHARVSGLQHSNGSGGVGRAGPLAQAAGACSAPRGAPAARMPSA
jgi:hypothetical protein